MHEILVRLSACFDAGNRTGGSEAMINRFMLEIDSSPADSVLIGFEIAGDELQPQDMDVLLDRPNSMSPIDFRSRSLVQWGIYRQ